MFYRSSYPFVKNHLLLIIAAVLPAAVLMWRVYRADRLEHESLKLSRRLIIAGCLAMVVSALVENGLCYLLGFAVAEDTVLYNVITYLGIVAFAEEGTKYWMLRRRTWRSEEFNCRFDGVVYAVFVSLGFAVLENVCYVLIFGFRTALLRAATAVPGHASFGVFMGVFYALAKKNEIRSNASASAFYRVLSVLLPALLHGLYDYIAVQASFYSTWVFVGFIIVLFAVSVVLIGRTSRQDRYFEE